MATIKDAKRYITECALLNVYKGNTHTCITPMMVGKAGIGKTQIVEEVAKTFARFGKIETEYLNFSSLDCSQTGDGDIAIPFAMENEQGKKEVVYILHHIFTPIIDIEEDLYERAINGGLLNGRVKIELDKNGNEYLIWDNNKKLVRDRLAFKKCGKYNKYKFGAELPGEIKLELLKSGEVPLWMILLDELNRADQMVMKQMMNVILERNVNGYQLPWWVQLAAAVNPSSQGTSYATNDMDTAQWSRFLRIDVTASLDDWVAYGIEQGYDPESLEAIATLDELFNGPAEGEENIDIHGCPRSWKLVCDMASLQKIFESGIFTEEEMKDAKGKSYLQADYAALVQGKVGVAAGASFLTAMRDAGNHIKPAEIFSLKSNKIDDTAMTKLKRMSVISRKIISQNCSRYIINMGDDLLELKKSNDAAKQKKWENFNGQMKEFISVLDPDIQVMFGRSLIDKYTESGNDVFGIVATSFSKEMMSRLLEMVKNTKEANNM